MCVLIVLQLEVTVSDESEMSRRKLLFFFFFPLCSKFGNDVQIIGFTEYISTFLAMMI